MPQGHIDLLLGELGISLVGLGFGRNLGRRGRGLIAGSAAARGLSGALLAGLLR